MKNRPAVELRDVTYYYPNESTPALENVSLRVSYGEFIVVAGPSGGGKSTLCKILLGLIPHLYGGRLTGEAYVDGVNVVREGVKSIVGRVGAVLQVPENQVVNIIVEEEIAFGLENVLYEPDVIVKRVDEVIEGLGISHLRNRATYTLSGGEVQRVALASALAYKPRILILDEPLAHLDPIGVRELLSILHRLYSRDGVTVIAIEHRLTELAKYATRLVILNKRILFDGEPERALEHSLTLGMDVPPIVRLFKNIGVSNPPLRLDDAIKELQVLLKNIDLSNFNNYANSSRDRELSREEVIVVEDLWYVYSSGREALRGINLEVRRGDFIAIVGANGAGKTTLIKHFNGLLKPSRGRVLVFSKDTRRHTVAELSRHVGIVFQNPLHQFFEENALREVMFTLRSMGFNNDEGRAMSILKSLNLHSLANKSPYELSVGEQRRLAIASVLVYEPEVIVLDEPTAGIDYSLKMELLRILLNLLEKGKTVIMTTHDVEFLAHAPVNRVVLMSSGEVVAQGDPREILYDAQLLAKARVTLPQIPELVSMAKASSYMKPLNAEELASIVNGSRCMRSG
ncbi:MAG: ABC transporter ATP-binding protein [Desulfurococcaceae archaeon]|nr:energy-coupling factor ABC transporter ATP-binding protein [Sulfolobales archaeon]MDW8170650.1 ABC transporter ATP-binding protein [Desulfurococcaceae archaeon]